MKKLELKNILLSVLSCLLLSCSFFADVADFDVKSSVLLVNSNSFEDVIAGSIYANQIGHRFVFILTPAHGKYWENFLLKSSDDVLYFESSNPVYVGMASSLQSLNKKNIVVISKQDLANLFYDKSSAHSSKSIVVGTSLGADALSVASYASATNSSVYFVDATQDVSSIVKDLKSKSREVLVYGKIADSLEQNGDAKIINTGSVYLDNVEMLSLYSSEVCSPNQLIFTSGRAFEASMVDPNYPVALVAQSQVHSALIDWINSNKISGGLIISDDVDISGSLSAIKTQTGIPIFAKIGQGFSGNAKVQSLAVMSIPYNEISLTLSSVQYSEQKGGFEVVVSNNKNTPVYVRLVATLQSGNLGSSLPVLISADQTQTVFVKVSTNSLSKISEAVFEVHTGSDPFVVEKIDSIIFKEIPISDNNLSNSVISKYTNGSSHSAQNLDMSSSMAISASIAIVLMLVASYLFIYHKPSSLLHHFKKHSKKQHSSEHSKSSKKQHRG